jgi:hypothetical protein
MSKKELSRRSVIKRGGLAGAAVAVVGSTGRSIAQGAEDHAQPGNDAIKERVDKTAFVDTHEHLIEEHLRLKGKHRFIKADDWSFLLSHYLDSDLRVSGMKASEYDTFFGDKVDPISKWKILEPYWGRVRNTGYGQAVDIAVRKLYGVEGLSEKTIRRIQDSYRRTVKPGFYGRILKEMCGIDSCQVNSLDRPFSESPQPKLLMQDISFFGMHVGPGIETYAPPTGVQVKDLSDWHSVIDWWFDKYASYAVAVKSQAAYSRNIDYEDVQPEQVEKIFRMQLDGQEVGSPEKKALEDHLFWYCVRKATENDLPVKLHTGYYAGDNYMPLSRLKNNAGAASDLCRMAPDTRFVFMHIDYPFYEDLLAVAKHYTNCYIDMCWAWIISPVASVNFLKQFLVTAPSNKVLTFGGDYIPVEPVIGHAQLARQGLSQALTELVKEDWVGLEDAVNLVDPIMRGNARTLFNLEKKAQSLGKAPWV